MKKNLKGFTLVEMLIVISIIAILSGAILAGMGSSRAKARNARIAADMNTLQLIIENAYTGGTYPADLAAISAVNTNDGIKAAAITTTGIKYCPASPSVGKITHYMIEGTLEAGKDADELVKGTVSGTATSPCTCPAYSSTSSGNTLFCIGE